jgi:hypothetical protein
VKGPFEWPMKDVGAPLGAYAWKAEICWIVSPEDVDAMHEDITVVLPVADPDADQPKITDVVGPAPLLAVIRLDRFVTQMLVEMVRLQERLKAYVAGSADIARKAGKSAAYGRALGEVGDLRAALADVLAFAIERLGYGGNGSANGEDH